MAAMPANSFLRSLVQVHPSRGEWTVATRAALSVLGPLLALWAADRMDWAMYAAFAALTSLYGRHDPLPVRGRVQAEAGISLVVAILIGVAVSMLPLHTWLVIPVVAAWATVMAIVAHRRRWHPPGVIFQTFALGGCASTAHTVGDLGPAAAVSLFTLAYCLLLTRLIGQLRQLWQARATEAAGVTRGSRRLPTGPDARADLGPEWPLRHYLLRYGVGVVVAGVVATGIGIGHPYWALVSVVVPMAAGSASARALRGVQRVIGTLAGVLLTWGILSLGPPPLVLIGIVVVMQVGAELFVGRNYAVALLFITPLALCMVQLANPLPPNQIVADRAIETVLGIAIAMIITLVTRERRQRGDTD